MNKKINNWQLDGWLTYIYNIILVVVITCYKYANYTQSTKTDIILIRTKNRRVQKTNHAITVLNNQKLTT